MSLLPVYDPIANIETCCSDAAEASGGEGSPGYGGKSFLSFYIAIL